MESESLRNLYLCVSMKKILFVCAVFCSFNFAQAGVCLGRDLKKVLNLLPSFKETELQATGKSIISDEILKALYRKSPALVSEPGFTIQYKFGTPGLDLKITWGESKYFLMHQDTLLSRPILKFRLAYDPSKFSRLHPVRMALGNNPLILTDENIAPIFSADKTISLDLTGLSLADQGDPNLTINLITGQLNLSPPGRDIFKENGSVSIWKASCEGIRQFYCEARMEKSKNFFGTWSAHPDSPTDSQ